MDDGLWKWTLAMATGALVTGCVLAAIRPPQVEITSVDQIDARWTKFILAPRPEPEKKAEGTARRGLRLPMLTTRGSSSGGAGGGADFLTDEAPARPSTGEKYESYGTNEMVDTAKDRRSTFAIDVDTGSYTLARSKLRSGLLPHPDGVRVEEFVNYARYDLDPPAGSRPIAVETEIAPNPWQRGHDVLRVSLKARELERRPVHLTFLVDVSGSMGPSDRLPLAKDALHWLVDGLDAEDTVALVTYAGDTRTVLEPTPTTRAYAIHDAIDSLGTGGGTAMGSGLDLAYDLAMAGYVDGIENRVIVLSDGDANLGKTTTHQEMLEIIEIYAKKGITLSTIGFGTGNYNDALMEQLADKGDGNYAYVDSFEEAQRVFGRDVAGTLQTVARDVKVQVAFDAEDVLAWRLIGYENRDIADDDFRDDSVDAGEIGSGHAVTALYDVILADEIDGNLASVHLRAKPPGPDAAAVEWNVGIPSARRRAEFWDASRDFRMAFAFAAFAEVLRGSPYAEELTYEQIARIADGSARRGHEEDAELVELVRRADEISP